MTKPRIISPHMLKRTAVAKLAELETLQREALAGDQRALGKLVELDVHTGDKLTVKKQTRRFYKWAVEAI